MTDTEIVIRPWYTLEADCLAVALRDMDLVPMERVSPSAAAAVLMQTRGHQEEDLVDLADGLKGLPTLLIVDVVDPRTMAVGQVLGAAGVISWSEDPQAVVRAVRDVMRGHRVRAPAPADKDPCRRMTDRELDVLALMTLGRRDEEIGDALGISINTVRTHVQHALMKLDVSHRRAAATVARNSARIHARLAVRDPQPGGAP